MAATSSAKTNTSQQVIVHPHHTFTVCAAVKGALPCQQVLLVGVAGHA